MASFNSFPIPKQVWMDDILSSLLLIIASFILWNSELYRSFVLLLRLPLGHVSWCDRVWPQAIVCWYNPLFPSLFIWKFVTDCEWMIRSLYLRILWSNIGSLSWDAAKLLLSPSSVSTTRSSRDLLSRSCISLCVYSVLYWDYYSLFNFCYRDFVFCTRAKWLNNCFSNFSHKFDLLTKHDLLVTWSFS